MGRWATMSGPQSPTFGALGSVAWGMLWLRSLPRRGLGCSVSVPALLLSSRLGADLELAGLFSHARFRGVRRAGQLPRISAFSGLDRRLCHSAVSSMETDCSTLQKSEDRMACAVGEILCMPCLFAKWQTRGRLKPGVIQPVTIS